MKTSNYLKLNLTDFQKGLLLAVIVAGYNFLFPLFKEGNYSIDWHQFLVTELTTIVSYLTKNLVTNSNGQIGK